MKGNSVKYNRIFTFEKLTERNVNVNGNLLYCNKVTTMYIKGKSLNS